MIWRRVMRAVSVGVLLLCAGVWVGSYWRAGWVEYMGRDYVYGMREEAGAIVGYRAFRLTMSFHRPGLTTGHFASGVEPSSDILPLYTATPWHWGGFAMGSHPAVGAWWVPLWFPTAMAAFGVWWAWRKPKTRVGRVFPVVVRR